MAANTSGANNTAVGADAMDGNQTGGENTAVGSNALGAATLSGSFNTGVGKHALLTNTSGGTNTAIGRNAMLANTTSSNNTAVGSSALAAASTGTNTAVGAAALTATTGGSNAALGYSALNINVGGSNNTAVGATAGDNLTSGNFNIAIGSGVDLPNATGSNQLTIGNLIFGTTVDGTGTTVSTGNAGVGVAAPGARLHVKGGAAATIGEIVQGAGSQSANLMEWQDSAAGVLSTVSENGYYTTRKVAAPADGELASSEVALWFDATNGAARMMIKGKSADGTVVTGSVTLA